jgi:tetratricopeptide (TPR) repeat protein
MKAVNCGKPNHSICFIIPTFVFFLLITSCSSNFIHTRRAKILYQQGQDFLFQGEKDKAAIKFEESFTWAQKAEFKPGIAHNLNEMAIIHTFKGEYDTAREKLLRAVDIYKELGMKPEVSKALSNLAITYVKKGEFAKAIVQYEKLLEWDKKIENHLGMGIALNNMGLIYENHLGKPKEAQKSYSRALKILKESGNEKYIKSVEKNTGLDQTPK